ncbi:aldehyde dehydrogenase family protein, partial [Actinocorallia aurantiaca]|uniref:aldehyde dehydrogenase family protein n=1 Tax=Actinocorallia aurantiaca TaxID=46204 RepID=UPI0031E2470F
MLLDAAQWQDKIFVDGRWEPGSGGTAEVTEPATGASLGSIGIADAADLARAAEGAAAAQREWAALPHPRRAA